MPAEPGPEARFIETSVSVVRLRVSPKGVIFAANAHAEALVGGPLSGRGWETLVLGFERDSSFAAWLSNSQRPRLLTVQTALGMPQTLQVTVEREGEDFILFGESDAAEQTKLGLDLLQLNADLTVLSRELELRNAELAEVLREREGLLRETHHRVKNNLALITSLMRITARQSRAPETRAVLQEMQARIHSVTALNEALYRTARYTTVELSAYLAQIANHLFGAQAPSSVRLGLDLQPVEMPTACAVPCGLIANELLTNSLKHGFPDGRSGEVRLSLRSEPDSHARLCIGDDGVGLPPDMGALSADSLGMQLVRDLVRQIGGVMEVGPGATFTVTF